MTSLKLGLYQTAILHLTESATCTSSCLEASESAAGENGRQDEEEGHASPMRLPEQPDGFIEPRNISRLAETVVKARVRLSTCRCDVHDLAQQAVLVDLNGFVQITPRAGVIQCGAGSSRVGDAPAPAQVPSWYEERR